MSTKILSPEEYRQVYEAAVKANTSELTDFSEGSIHDVLAGALTTAMNEASELLVFEFKKTFFNLAEGENLDNLAVDHFGESFSRPEATVSTAGVTFSRPNADAGSVVIPAATIIKTVKDSDGNEVRFSTDSEVTMVGTEVDAQVTSIDAGESQNVPENTIIEIESALTDPTVEVTNPNASAGGINEQTDDEYRETIKDLIVSLAGATEQAIRSAVEAIAGIEYVALITVAVPVKEWDIIGDAPLGDYFYIPYSRVYIADVDGNSSASLISLAEDAINQVRAAGVKIEVVGATPQIVDWTASISLNPAGPNFAEFSSDVSKITETMKNYINDQLLVGDGFNKTVANEYMLAIWGSTGTGDLDTFITSIPTGNITGVTGSKLIAGTMSIA